MLGSTNSTYADEDDGGILFPRIGMYRSEFDWSRCYLDGVKWVLERVPERRCWPFGPEKTEQNPIFVGRAAMHISSRSHKLGGRFLGRKNAGTNDRHQLSRIVSSWGQRFRCWRGAVILPRQERMAEQPIREEG